MEQPTMMTIRQTAATGILSESALRTLVKSGKIKAVYIGNRALINFQQLVEQLNSTKED